MDNVLADLNGKCCLVYLDDIINFSASLHEHITDLNSVLQRLRLANLKMQPHKSEFLRKEIEYLRHIVTENGIKPNAKKIAAIKGFLSLVSRTLNGRGAKYYTEEKQMLAIIWPNKYFRPDHKPLTWPIGWFKY